MATMYNAIIIGTGQAGPSLEVRLASAGMKVAIVERNRFGGTCVNTGCIPTKTLVASARAAHMAQNASEYGLTIGGSIAVDMKKVKERKDAVAHRFPQDFYAKELPAHLSTAVCEIRSWHKKS